MKRKILKNILFQRYHYGHKQTANAVLKSIESVKGPTEKSLIRLSNEYAEDVLGWKGYAPWLHVYSAISKEFKEGWIPDNYYGQFVVPMLKGPYGKIGDCKSLTRRLFNSELFPDAYYYVNSLWLSSDYTINSIENVKKDLYENRKKFVYKADFSERGKSILILTSENNNIHKIVKNGVIQDYIEQHPFFNEITPNSVPTVRLTTAIDECGNVSLRACVLRVGRKEDTYVKASSNLRIPVDINSGELHEFGYTLDWLEITKHLDSGFIFKGKVIPNFEKCVSAVLELHKKVPFTRIIGWDVIVDVNGNVKIMEWNGQHNDIKISEAVKGPILTGLGLESLWKS